MTLRGQVIAPCEGLGGACLEHLHWGGAVPYGSLATIVATAPTFPTCVCDHEISPSPTTRLAPKGGVKAASSRPGAPRHAVANALQGAERAGCRSPKLHLGLITAEYAMSVHGHSAPRSLKVCRSTDHEKYVAAQREKPDWAAFEDAKIEGYTRPASFHRRGAAPVKQASVR